MLSIKTRRLLSAARLVGSLTFVAACGSEAGPPTGPTPNPDSYSYSQIGQIQGSSQGIASAALSPDGTVLAYGEYGSNAIRIVNTQTRAEIRVLTGHTAPVTELTFSPNGRYLASQGTVNLPPGTDGSIRIWDLQNGGAQLASVSTPGIGDLAFSPDGAQLASASGGDPVRIQLWSATTLAPVRAISNVFRKVAFSPSGQRIAALARDEQLRLFDAGTGAEVAAFPGHTGWVTSVAFNADGTMLVSGGEDRGLRLWNPVTGATIRTITGHTSYPEWMSFSPTGKVLASLGSGTNITRSGGSVTISFGSADRHLRLWDVETGNAMPQIDTGNDVVGVVQFSSNWNVLVTGSNSGLIRVFTR